MMIRNPASVLRSNTPISMEQLRQVVPSAFAEEAHASRSDRYTFIPTAAVLTGLEREGFLPYAAMQQRVRQDDRRDYTRHLIRFRHPGKAPAAIDDIIPEIVLLNSHDGSSSYRLMAGLFRLVCLNGLTVSEGTCAEVTVHHKGDVVGQVIEGAFQVLDDTAKAVDASQRFRRIALTDPEQQAFGKAAAELRWGEETPVEPEAVIRPRRPADRAADLWTVFNRTQENILRGGLHGRTTTNRRMTTREVTGVAENVRLNRALWTLTEQMARLKTA